MLGPEGLEVIANDQGQYFQNYINAVNILFSLLLVNTRGATASSRRLAVSRVDDHDHDDHDHERIELFLSARTTLYARLKDRL